MRFKHKFPPMHIHVSKVEEMLLNALDIKLKASLKIYQQQKRRGQRFIPRLIKWAII